MSKTHKHNRNQAQAPRPAVPASSGRYRLLLVLLALMIAGATWAIFEFVVWNKLPRDLVGKWVVTEPTEQEGAVFDFFRSGAMVGVINVRGQAEIVNATIRVEGANMYATTRRPSTGEELTRVQVIRTLTENELVLQDEKGQLLKMKRAD